MIFYDCNLSTKLLFHNLARCFNIYCGVKIVWMIFFEKKVTFAIKKFAIIYEKILVGFKINQNLMRGSSLSFMKLVIGLNNFLRIV